MLLFISYLYVQGLFVYVQLSKYQYETTTDIHYKTSWAQADTCTITLKKPYKIIKTDFTETIFRERENTYIPFINMPKENGLHLRQQLKI